MTSNALQPAALGNVTPRCSPNAIRLSGDVLRNVSRLSDAELTRSLCALVRRDHQVTADLLIHLGELDARRLYAAMGYSSLFGYCVTALSFSEDVAYKRVAAARIARRYPVVLELVAGGKIHLSALLLVAPHLTPGGHQELLSAACGKSKREVERLVAERFPRPDVKTSVCKPPERSVVRNNGAGAGAELGEQRRRFAVRPSSARESKRVRVERRASTPRPSSASATPPRAEQAPGRVRPSSSSPSLGAEQDPGRLIPATGRTNPSRYIP
ncbi:MAG: hypothetical protein JW940_08530, partial [Polyangiaceae bacterium]|nr:hypothetical protein [Polyangiaceae bacterium]